MGTYYDNAMALIGHTPLVKLDRLSYSEGLDAALFAKLESSNLTGSVKDRVALSMIRDAEESGRLRDGGTIIEPTSGNTGIGLAAIGALLGYRVVIVMPDTMTIERRKLIQVYGADVVLTPGALGMRGAIAEAERLAAETPGAMLAGQFENPANAKAHYETTGPEIWQDMDGQVDMLVAGVGTGGSLTGIGRFLKERNPEVRIVAVEPAASAVLSGKDAGAHAIQGIGAGFVPEVLDRALIDQIVCVENEAAIQMTRRLAREEGLFVGISSGAAVAGALEVLRGAKGQYLRVAVVLPDTGMRYLSSEALFQ